MPWRLASAAVSAYGVHQQNKNIDKQLAAQQRENTLNRKYNLKLAMLQNKWNRQQWQMENAYNSPSAQIQRMRAAGLNPDMMYGGGVSGNLSASSPSMTSGAPSSPMDFTALGSKRTLGDIALHTAQLNQIEATTAKIKAETQGQEHQNDILASDAAFRDAWNEQQLKKGDVEIQFIGSQTSLNEESVPLVRQQVKEAFARTEQLNKSLQVMDAQIANYDSETAYNMIKGAIEQKLGEEKIKNMAAERHLTYAQAKNILDQLPHIITQYQDEKGLRMENGAVLKKQGQLLQLQVESEERNPRRLGGMWTSIYHGVDFVNDVVEAISPFIGASPKSVTTNNTTNQYLDR